MTKCGSGVFIYCLFSAFKDDLMNCTTIRICVSLLLFASIVNAQSAEESEVKKSVETFFKGFHEQDSLVIKATVDQEIRLQTMGRDKEGNSRLRTDSFSEFLKSIVSIPDSINYREELLDIKVRIDGPMAHAWTPYRFWINGELSHCGVNSFQLFHDGSNWKIIYLADTRRREQCE